MAHHGLTIPSLPATIDREMAHAGPLYSPHVAAVRRHGTVRKSGPDRVDPTVVPVRQLDRATRRVSPSKLEGHHGLPPHGTHGHHLRGPFRTREESAAGAEPSGQRRPRHVLPRTDGYSYRWLAAREKLFGSARTRARGRRASAVGWCNGAAITGESIPFARATRRPTPPFRLAAVGYVVVAAS